MGRHSKAQPPAVSPSLSGPVALAVLGQSISALLFLLLQELGILVPFLVARHLGLSTTADALRSMLTCARVCAVPLVWLGVGCSIPVGHALGSKDGRTLSDTMHSVAALSILLGLLCAIVSTLLAQPLLGVAAIPASLTTEALDYWYLACGTSLLTVPLCMLLAAQRAASGIAEALVATLADLAATVGASLLLMGRLSMGAQGAGIAIAFGQLVGLVICVWSLTHTTRPHRLRLSQVRIMWPQVIAMAGCALPLVVQAVAMAGFQVLSPTFLASFGDDMLTTWSLASTGELCAMLVADAIAMATVVVVSQAFGAALYERINRGMHVALTFSLLAVGAIAMVGCTLTGRLVGLMGSRAIPTTPAQTVMALILPFSMLYALVAQMGAALRGAGINVRPTVVTVVGCCLVPLAILGVVLPMYHSVLTAALARPLGWGLAAIAMLVYYRHGRWLTLALRKARRIRKQRASRHRRTRRAKAGRHAA